MTTTCPPCQPLAYKVDNLNAEIENLQDLLHHIGSGGKPGVLKKIEELNAQLDTAQGDLDDCIQRYCPPVPMGKSILTGVVNLTSTKHGQYSSNISLTFEFPPSLNTFYIEPFGPIQPMGSLVSAGSTGQSGAQLDVSAGSMAIAITLGFVYDGNESTTSTATFQMATQNPIDSTGNITIGSSSTPIVGGWDDGDAIQIVVVGQLSPWPPVIG